MLYSPLAYTLSVMAATAAGAVQTAADRQRLLSATRVASRRIDREMGAKRPLFVPARGDWRLRVTPDRVNSHDNTLALDVPMATLEGATVGTRSLTFGTDVEGYPDPDNAPYSALRLMTCCAGWYGIADDCYTSPLFATVLGISVLHTDYANAWARVDALTANIDASVTSISVADVDGADAYGLTPRISDGNLLRIGDEFMEVLAVNTTTNAVTVRRGVNGTTAAAHVATDGVDVFMVEDPIRYITARQAGLIYARAGAYVTVEVSGLGNEVRYPADLLQELKAVLQDYQFVY